MLDQNLKKTVLRNGLVIAVAAVLAYGCSKQETPEEPVSPKVVKKVTAPEKVSAEPPPRAPKQTGPKVVETPPATLPEPQPEPKAAVQPAEVDPSLDGLEGAERIAEILALAARLSEEDPERAIKLLMELPEGPERFKALSATFLKLARSNPELAVAILENMEKDENVLTSFLPTVAYAIAKNRPGDATRLAAHLPPGDLRSDLVKYIANKWEPGNLEKSSGWAWSLAEPDMQEGALYGIAGRLAYEDVNRAMEWVNNISEGSQHDAAMGGLVATLANSDLDRAAEMVLGLPEGFGRDEGIAAVVGHMTGQDIEKTLEWIGELSPSRSRDRAYEAYILSRLPLDPDYRQGFEKDVADLISDPAIRQGTERQIAEMMLMHMPPETATAYVRNSSLPEKEKERLLRNAGL